MPSRRSGTPGREFPVVGLDDLPRSIRTKGAFVPPRLPRVSQLTLRLSTCRHLAEAQEALGRLDAASLRLPSRAGLVRLTRHRDARASAAMDGIFVSTRAALAADLPGSVTPEVDERLLPYLDVAEEATAAMRDHRPIDLALLGQLTSIMAGAPVSGVVPWRRQPGWLGGPDPRDAYLITTPPGATLRTRTNQWCDWIARDHEMPLVAKGALAHFQFTVLAPFIGSAHLARVYLTMEILRSGVLGDAVLPISAWLRRKHREYARHLRGVVDRGDLDAWMTFMATVIRLACEQQIHLITELERVHERMRRKFKRLDAMERLLDGLIGYPVINNAQIASLCDVSPGYAQTLARRLQNAGIAEVLDTKTFEYHPDDNSYGKVIFCPEIVRLLSVDQPLPGVA